ncbi:hypothetical protein ACOSQ4_001702 [Xanthoceras sorbifolium]
MSPTFSNKCVRNILVSIDDCIAESQLSETPFHILNTSQPAPAPALFDSSTSLLPTHILQNQLYFTLLLSALPSLTKSREKVHQHLDTNQLEEH